MISHILSRNFPLKALSKTQSVPSCYYITLAHNAVLQASSITEAYDVSGHHSAREQPSMCLPCTPPYYNHYTLKHSLPAPMSVSSAE